MIGTKHLISGLAAGALVTVVSLAYAQTTSTPPTSDGAQPQSTTPSSMDPNSTTPSPTGSNDSAGASSTTEPAPQADRN